VADFKGSEGVSLKQIFLLLGIPFIITNVLITVFVREKNQ
jgi:hypothetical protein